jgi:hypothetical protein
MDSVCVVKHHDGVNSTKILSVAERCFYCKFVLAVTIKRTKVFV